MKRTYWYNGFPLHFISLDGTRSTYNDSKFYSAKKWKDEILSEGAYICKVETMLSKSSGCLEGFKWFGVDGGVSFRVKIK